MDKKLVSLLTFSIIASCAQSQCNTNAPYLQDCAALFKIFRSALFNTSEADNIFLLQSVFYPSTQVSPVLVKVTYKLNITTTSHQLKSCPGPESTFCLRWRVRSLTRKIIHSRGLVVVTTTMHKLFARVNRAYFM